MRLVARTTWLSTFCLLGLWGVAAADSTFDIGAGVATPLGDVNRYWGQGISVNASYLYETTPFIAFGLSGGYHKMALDRGAYRRNVGLASDADVSGGDLSVITACGEFRLKTGAMDKAAFYGCLGLGVFIVGISDLTAPSAVTGIETTVSFDSATRIGGYAGAGFGLPVSPRLKIGADARYNLYSVRQNSDLRGVGQTRQFVTVRAMAILGL